MSEAKGMMRVELLIPFSADFDSEEFAEWSADGSTYSDENAVKEFIKSSRDWWIAVSIESPSWMHGVVDYDIESVSVHPDGGRDA